MSEDPFNFENVVNLFARMPPLDGTPIIEPSRLPDDDAVADGGSKWDSLAYAVTDDEKKTALRDLALWLSQWKF